MDRSKIPANVLSDLKVMHEDAPEILDRLLKNGSSKRVFKEWCRYHGLLGDWGDQLWETMEQMKEGER